MLCERNHDVTYYTLFIACIAVCEKVSTPWAGRSIDAAHSGRGTHLHSGKKQKLESVGDWCNRKGMQSAYLRYDNNLSKCKQSVFARYRAPSMLLAFKFCQTLRLR